jgi:hypothetical protein
MQTNITEKDLLDLQTIAFKADGTSTSSFAVAFSGDAKGYVEQGTVWKKVKEAALQVFHGQGSLTVQDVYHMRTMAYQKPYGLSISPVHHEYGSYDASYRWAGKPEGFTEYRYFYAFKQAYEADQKGIEKARLELRDMATEKCKEERTKRLAQLGLK